MKTKRKWLTTRTSITPKYTRTRKKYGRNCTKSRPLFNERWFKIFCLKFYCFFSNQSNVKRRQWIWMKTMTINQFVSGPANVSTENEKGIERRKMERINEKKKKDNQTMTPTWPLLKWVQFFCQKFINKKIKQLIKKYFGNKLH